MIKPDNGSHWYKRLTGDPIYELIGKNGNPRPPTIRDAVEMDLVPSVTTIIQVIDKPGLDVWKQTQLLLSALTHPKRNDLKADEFAKLVIEESKQEATFAANLGSRIHAAIEWVLTASPDRSFTLDDDIAPTIFKFSQWANQNELKAETCESCFANETYGGRIDCKGSFQGKPAIIEFKTQRTNGKCLKHYPEWGVQLAAYFFGETINLLTEEEDENCQLVSIAISSDEPGRIDYKVWGNRLELFEVFENALRIWQWRNRWNERKLK